MKKLFLVIVAITGLTFTINLSLFAQKEKVANKLYYTEFGGPGLIMSANFDSRFKSNTQLGLGFRIGAGFGVGRFDDKQVVDPNTGDISYEKVARSVYAFPVGLNYVFGNPKTNTNFEFGGGISLISREMSLYNYEVKKYGQIIGFVTFMYRIVPVDGGFSFRIGFTPIIGTAGDMYPMGAISFGYAF